MPAACAACGALIRKSRLIAGRANERFVRSIKAIVYMMNATGMIRIQRFRGTFTCCSISCDLLGGIGCPSSNVSRIGHRLRAQDNRAMLNRALTAAQLPEKDKMAWCGDFRRWERRITFAASPGVPDGAARW